MYSYFLFNNKYKNEIKRKDNKWSRGLKETGEFTLKEDKYLRDSLDEKED